MIDNEYSKCYNESKLYPINAKEDKKKVYYEISDNLLRFYYTYIYKNKGILQVIGSESFYNMYIEPSIITFISHRFEEIARNYFSLQVRRERIKGVLDIGTYYYDDIDRKQNGEFDVALKTVNGYEIYEVKYYSDKMKGKEMLEEEKQINCIRGIDVSKIGFVTVSGVEIKYDRFNYIDGIDLYYDEID